MQNRKTWIWTITITRRGQKRGKENHCCIQNAKLKMQNSKVKMQNSKLKSQKSCKRARRTPLHLTTFPQMSKDSPDLCLSGFKHIEVGVKIGISSGVPFVFGSISYVFKAPIMTSFGGMILHIITHTPMLKSKRVSFGDGRPPDGQRSCPIWSAMERIWSPPKTLVKAKPSLWKQISLGRLVFPFGSSIKTVTNTRTWVWFLVDDFSP